MADSSLQAIRTKVRRLTRNPSTSQITDAQIDEYVNTFVLYDFPEHLRLFEYKTTFTFTCNAFQDVYPTDTASFVGVTANPLYNFQNKYITLGNPLYIAGFRSLYTQSREQFFGIYPKVNSISSIGSLGDGVTTLFTGAINTNGAILPTGLQQQITLLQNEVLFSSVDINFQGLALIDVCLKDPLTGNNTIYGNLYVPGTEPVVPPQYPADLDATNNINYFTGAYTITFPYAPAAGYPINSQTVPQIISLPQAMCYYDDQFIIRPVPDQPYRIQFETYIRPTELLDSAQSPKLEQYWQYIAYGASKKIFEDKSDDESIISIMPEFKKQEALVLRRTLMQLRNERTATIYTEQSNFGQGGSGWGWGGGSNL